MGKNLLLSNAQSASNSVPSSYHCHTSLSQSPILCVSVIKGIIWSPSADSCVSPNWSRTCRAIGASPIPTSSVFSIFWTSGGLTLQILCPTQPLLSNFRLHMPTWSHNCTAHPHSDAWPQPAKKVLETKAYNHRPRAREDFRKEILSSTFLPSDRTDGRLAECT